MTIAKFQGGAAVTMSSQEIADLVGSRHDDVKRSIDRLVARGVISQPPMADGPKAGNGVVVQEYRVSKRDSYVIVAQLSPEFTAALVDRWQALEERAARPMTQAEITAANANHLVAVERQQREQQLALERIERRVEDLSQTTMWDYCPQNCQSLTRIKETMLARHGLSGAVVDYVLKVWPNQPNPAGMVRNGHEEALGSQYLVWSKSHVTAAFHRFVFESTMVTATQATHPYFEGRFRLVQKVPH
ncbi:Rha family transcriptional regulator [Pseudomonas aphyarum]|uniref:Rha family transcriptional regulator n=1 Tax=Pseudomonas aphyarum TaxID=2942629 RepID=A0ABT5PV43_9PSED|nr:Rha family transcriptional regulator [Pseudomonas aphyarum]MDD0969701.1 Rha family transcriptional regulator [Pseudomonas aphyarum]MDD1127781.1 Rha family transcriptional regulator [Pseudomonas aphyarum]